MQFKYAGLFSVIEIFHSYKIIGEIIVCKSLYLVIFKKSL